MLLPDLLRDIGQESIAIFDPDKSIDNFLLEMCSQFVETTKALGVERDFVAGIMVSEDEPREKVRKREREKQGKDGYMNKLFSCHKLLNKNKP
jgi:hypothetical protein